MKRIISLLLILMLVTCCSTAMASDFGVSTDDYLTYARILISSTDLEAKEIDLTADRGFPCKCFVFTNMDNDNRMFVYGENVESIEIVSTSKLLVENAEAYGEMVGRMNGIGVYSLWIAQHINDDDSEDKLLSILVELSTDMRELLLPMSNMSIFDPIHLEGPLCGYPTVFESEFDIASFEYTMRYYIAPDQSMINAYKAH